MSELLGMFGRLRAELGLDVVLIESESYESYHQISSENIARQSSLVNAIESIKPSTWGPVQHGTEVKLERLHECSTEYKNVARRILARGKEISKIVRVENPFLWGCYQLKKAECETRGEFTEKTLYHATDIFTISSIVKGNLNWARSNRTQFGQGVTFSLLPDAFDLLIPKHMTSALIVAKVMVGHAHKGKYETKLPVPGFDTTANNSGNVFVKYYDNEFYPEYVVYYNIITSPKRLDKILRDAGILKYRNF